ncbi:MAG: hypothetical protein LUQ71_02675 [Methanoregula sp.]|nr:hypothetical protein [Methanoregula sp.]
MKNFQQTLIFHFQSNFVFKNFIAIMIAIEKQFRIKRTLIEIVAFEKPFDLFMTLQRLEEPSTGLSHPHGPDEPFGLRPAAVAPQLR